MTEAQAVYQRFAVCETSVLLLHHVQHVLLLRHVQRVLLLQHVMVPQALRKIN